MTRGTVGADVVRGKLEELHRVRGEAGRRRVSHELSRLLELACLDSPLIAEVASALERHGLPTDGLAAADALARGEAFALFVGPEGGVAGRVQTGEGPGRLVDAGVVRNVLRALSRVATRAGRRMPLDTEIARVIGAGSHLVEGGSHGLAVASAFLSRALGRAPVRYAVAAACVAVDGGLHPVHDLRFKLAAIRQRWPGVTDVVVASGQDACSSEGWNVRVARTLGEGLAFLGLDLLELRPDESGATDLEIGRDPSLASTDAYRDRAEALLADAARWERAAFFAQVRAAHCLVHAGDADAAQALLPPLALAEQLGNEAYARCLTIRATAAIDRADASDCVGDAALAVEALGRSPDADPLLLGEAVGTLGRAYLRMAAYQDAVVHLEAACHHFDAFRPAESARTRTHLATALRMGGQPEAAREVVERALRDAGDSPSRVFQLLERARCLLAMGDAEGAAADCRGGLEIVSAGALYPRVGLLLTLREAARALGHAEVARDAGERIDAVRGGAGCPEVIARLVDGGVGVEMY